MRLTDKVAIVTGGASGYGAGIVERFVAEGARVLIADIDEAGARARVESLAAGRAVAFSVDVTDAAQTRAMVDRALAEFGRLDVLVNNAGLGQRPVATEDTSGETFQQIMDVNVRGVHLGCVHAIPVFRAQGSGAIINTSSAIALAPRPKLAAYAASKGAVNAYTQSLALELAAQNIRVNAICPVAGDTPMLTEFMGGTESNEARSRFIESVPMGRLSTAQDIGHAAVFLASDEASLVTGVLLPVDGGRSV